MEIKSTNKILIIKENNQLINFFVNQKTTSLEAAEAKNKYLVENLIHLIFFLLC